MTSGSVAVGPRTGRSPEVRRVRDVEELTALRRLAEEHVRFEHSDTVVPTDWAERIAGLVRSRRIDVFAADWESTAVGYATLTREVSTWTGTERGHLDCLYVDAAWRGAGTGRALMTAVLAHAAGTGLVEVQWQTPAWNEPAIGFYEKFGATHTTKERFTLRFP